MRSASETRAGVYLGSTSIALLHARERDALGLLRSRARARGAQTESQSPYAQAPLRWRCGARGGSHRRHASHCRSSARRSQSVAIKCSDGGCFSSECKIACDGIAMQGNVNCNASRCELCRIAQCNPVPSNCNALQSSKWTAMHSIAASVREVRCGERRDASA